MICLLSACVLTATAQGTERRPVGDWRPKYRNLNFNTEKMIFSDNSSIKSEFGAAFTAGRTYYLHRTPILRMIRIGLDATWFDINYANYKQKWFDGNDFSDRGNDFFDDEEIDDDGEIKNTIHKGEIGLHVGPSVTVNPLGKLGVHVYFRYAPTFAMMYNDGAFRGNYVSMFVTGASVSYGIIGVGIEKRWGTGKYKTLFGGDDLSDLFGDYISTGPMKIKTSGMRAYLSFRLGR